MNRLPLTKRAQIIQLLAEGNSLRSCSRIADVSINTVMKLLVDVGKACLRFHSQTIVKIRCKRVQCDEIWSFVFAKDKNIKEPKYGVGSVWTWVALDPDSKLVISWFAGDRDLQSAKFFMNDLWCRLATRVQLTTDGLEAYVESVADTFGGKVDFAQLVKQYSTTATNAKGESYKSERYVGAKKKVIAGRPDLKYVSTSLIERQNLTIRMHSRRFTRETNAFSKRIDNHRYALAIHFVYYNFVRIHKTLRVTPAMTAKLTKTFMSFADIANLVDLYKNPTSGAYPVKH